MLKSYPRDQRFLSNECASRFHQFTINPGGVLSLQKSQSHGNRVLRRNVQQYGDMIRLRIPLQQIDLPLSAQILENFTNLLSAFSKEHPLAILLVQSQRDLCSPTSHGPGAWLRMSFCDRGGEIQLVLGSPLSEPDVQISRIRFSG